MDFFSKNSDAQNVKESQFMDDLDLVLSKEVNGASGPALVAVAMRGGVHVCWQCGEMFADDARSPKRRVEVQLGHSRILLHAKCVNPSRPVSMSTFYDKVRGHQLRRFATKAFKMIPGGEDK